MMDISRYCVLILLLYSATSWSDRTANIDAARQDLASRLQVPVNQVSVISQTEKIWPDGSLGCPRKGMNYKQVISNGSQLVLSVAGRHYFYHSGAGNAYFYCAKPAKQIGVSIDTPITDTADW